jgi:hypothetical protein
LKEIANLETRIQSREYRNDRASIIIKSYYIEENDLKNSPGANEDLKSAELELGGGNVVFRKLSVLHSTVEPVLVHSG